MQYKDATPLVIKILKNQKNSATIGKIKANIEASNPYEVNVRIVVHT